MNGMEAKTLLKETINERGAARVAADLGYSRTTISMVLNGKYPSSTEKILKRVVETYGTAIVECPVLGPITIKKCSHHKRQPFAATNQLRSRLYRACMECDVEPKPKED